MRIIKIRLLLIVSVLSSFPAGINAQTTPQDQPQIQMPNGKFLGEVPGHPRPTNNFPTAAAISPDGRFAVLLHSGFGAYSSDGKQSL